MLTGAPSTGGLLPWPAAILMAWRREVIAEVFAQEPGSELLAANRDYYARHIDDGTHEAFVAVADGEEAGCGGLCLYQELPSPDNPTGRCAYLEYICAQALPPPWLGRSHYAPSGGASPVAPLWQNLSGEQRHGFGALRVARVPSDGPHDAGPIVYREQARQDHFSGLGL